MAPACQLCGSVGGGFRKGTMASAPLNSRHFIFSLYATGIFQAATLVLELIGSESELVNPCVGSLRGTAWGSRSFFHLLNPHWFLHPEVVRTQHWNPGLEGAGVGPRLLTPEMCLLNFYPPHVGLGTSPIHACAPHSSLDG